MLSPVVKWQALSLMWHQCAVGQRIDRVQGGTRRTHDLAIPSATGRAVITAAGAEERPARIHT